MDSAFPPMYPGLPVRSVYERAGFEVKKSPINSGDSKAGYNRSSSRRASASTHSQRSSSKMSSIVSPVMMSPSTANGPDGGMGRSSSSNSLRNLSAGAAATRPPLATIPSVPESSEYKENENSEAPHFLSDRQQSSGSLDKQDHLRLYDFAGTDTQTESRASDRYGSDDLAKRLSQVSLSSSNNNNNNNKNHMLNHSEDFDFGWPTATMAEVSPISSTSMFDRTGGTQSAASSADFESQALSAGSKHSHRTSNSSRRHTRDASIQDQLHGQEPQELDYNHELDYSGLDSTILPHEHQDFFDSREILNFSMSGTQSSRSNSQADTCTTSDYALDSAAAAAAAAPIIPPKRKRKICRGCSEPILGKAVAAAGGQVSGKWHRDCFVCQRCFSALREEFYVLNDWPYCQECYHTENNSLCQVCGLGIEGDCLETSCEEESQLKRYHCACLTCSECCEPIADSEYYTMNGQPLCSIHAEEIFTEVGRDNAALQKRATRLMVV